MDKEQEKPEEPKIIHFIFCTDCGREKEDPTLDLCSVCIDNTMAAADGR